MGPQPTIANQSLQVGVTKTEDIAKLIVLLAESSSIGRVVHFLPPYREEDKIKPFEWLKIVPGKAKETARVIIRGLKDLGLMKGNVEDALINGAYALFFPCGLGRMMGLDVHDMEDLVEVHVRYSGEAKSTQFGLKSLRLGRKLESGFVFTIEPGIYFSPELIEQWKKQTSTASIPVTIE